MFVSVLLFLRFLRESKKSGLWRTDFWWSQKVSSRRGGTRKDPLLLTPGASERVLQEGVAERVLQEGVEEVGQLKLSRQGWS